MALPFFDRIVEERILEAQKAGQFDDLPGRGRPLQLEDDSMVPEDLRLAYKILKNARCLPPELELRGEIVRLRDLMAAIEDDEARRGVVEEINSKILRLNLMTGGRVSAELGQIYFRKAFGTGAVRDE